VVLTNYLSKDELASINREVVKISGDPHGVMNDANLTHLIEAICFKYEGDADAIVLKAAFLLDYLANKGHVFIEGNKRTATTATITFLSLNGLIFVEQDQAELTGFILSVARNEKSLTQIAKWLKQRIKSVGNE